MGLTRKIELMIPSYIYREKTEQLEECETSRWKDGGRHIKTYKYNGWLVVCYKDMSLPTLLGRKELGTSGET